jgi:hypothetical protein
MKDININGHDIEMYDSIEEMPIVRYNSFNRYSIIDSGLGNTFADVDQKISETIGLLNSDQKEKAVQSLLNMRNTYYFMFENIDPKCSSFICMIKSIDGKPNDDISENGILKTREILMRTKITRAMMITLLGELKKKLIVSLKSIFQNLLTNRKVSSST